MGWDVHLHVCFPCDKNDGVAEIAKRHIETLRKIEPKSEDYFTRNVGFALHFLEDLAARSGPNPGGKGGLSLWGIVGNHVDAEAFVETLVPFWFDILLPTCEDGPYLEHVVVFFEEEQSQRAQCFEISLDDDTGVLKRRLHSLPFCWNQY